MTLLTVLFGFSVRCLLYSAFFFSFRGFVDRTVANSVTVQKNVRTPKCAASVGS